MISLEAGTVHLYRGRMNSLPVPLDALYRLLSAPERARVTRFHWKRDRDRQTATTGLLRMVLAEYLACEPALLEFARGPHGKPSLPAGPAFNLSHSGDDFLIGVAAEGRLGVDIEKVRPLSDLEMLARGNFAPDEVEALLATPSGERERAFYRAWTRKEAYLKALGRGLTLPLDSFSVSLLPGPAGALLRANTPAEHPSHWTVRSVTAGPSVEAAVAWDRPACRVRSRTLIGRAQPGDAKPASDTMDRVAAADVA